LAHTASVAHPNGLVPGGAMPYDLLASVSSLQQAILTHNLWSLQKLSARQRPFLTILPCWPFPI